MRQVQMPPKARLNLPAYITTWLGTLARAKACVTVPAWKRLQAVLGNLLDAKLLALAEALEDESVRYQSRTTHSGDDLHHKYRTEECMV